MTIFEVLLKSVVSQFRLACVEGAKLDSYMRTLVTVFRVVDNYCSRDDLFLERYFTRRKNIKRPKLILNKLSCIMLIQERLLFKRLNEVNYRPMHVTVFHAVDSGFQALNSSLF